MKQHNIPSNKKDRVQFATYLSRKIEHKIVKITDIENFWPPYFPTLTHVISSSGGYLKSVVYKDPEPKALEDLRNNAKREIRRIKPQTLEKVYHNVLVRLQNVLGRKGAWIEHLMNACG